VINKDTQELIEAIGDYTAGKLRGDLAEAADKLGARQSAQLDRIEANVDLLLGHMRGLTARVNALEGNCAQEHSRALEAVPSASASARIKRRSNAP
jgi:hypothetical protein